MNFQKTLVLLASNGLRYGNNRLKIKRKAKIFPHKRLLWKTFRDFCWLYKNFTIKSRWFHFTFPWTSQRKFLLFKEKLKLPPARELSRNTLICKKNRLFFFFFFNFFCSLFHSIYISALYHFLDFLNFRSTRNKMLFRHFFKKRHVTQFLISYKERRNKTLI